MLVLYGVLRVQVLYVVLIFEKAFRFELKHSSIYYHQ